MIPALVAALALVVGVALIDGGGFTVIRFIVSIFALIVAVFAWQAGQWWWLVPLVAIAVVWNPVIPLDFGPAQLWLGLQYGAAAVFIAAGILIKVVDKAKATPQR